MAGLLCSKASKSAEFFMHRPQSSICRPALATSRPNSAEDRTDQRSATATATAGRTIPVW
ncbi:MAG: hypothetical protein ACK5KS_24910 [Planctomyces sp.]